MPKRDYLYSANGIRILCDTRYVPFPIGRNNYETAVFKSDKHGNIKKPGEPLEIITADDEASAIKNHSKMIEKWASEAVL